LRRYCCNCSINSFSICKVVPSTHLTWYNTIRDNALHMHTQHLSVDWNRGATSCLERYMQRDMLCLCVCNNHPYNQSNAVHSCGHCYHNYKCSLVIVSTLVSCAGLKAVESFLETCQCQGCGAGAQAILNGWSRSQRLGKSCSFQWKKNFLVWGCGFFLVMS